MRKLFIQFSVTDGQYPVGIFGIGNAVCDKNDGFAAFVAGEKQFHYFLSGAAVKISARLVRKDKVGVCGDCSCDSDTLLLSCGLIPENELSRGMGVDISPVTNGPVVDESLQTSIPGVFAAGNVLHVHDLVDYVSEEAAAAGRAAVRYLAQGETGERHEIPITFEGGIRYTVPASIDPKLVQDDLVLRFRVGGVMKKRVVKLYLGDEAVVSRKRPVMAPGEMEELKLTKDMLAAHPGLSRIHITVEEA